MYFISFADKRYNKSLSRINAEAHASGLFKSIETYNEDYFESWYIERFRSRFVERGFGYWQWKPYVISRKLEQIKEDDYLLYVDAGCTINKYGSKRFCEYLDMLDDSHSGILVFEQGLATKDWTKGDVFSYFNVLDDVNYTEKNR